MRDKKAQVQSIAPAIIALLIAGFFLVMGIIILQNLRDTSVSTDAVNAVVTNETIASVADTPKNVALVSSTRMFDSFVVSTCINTTGGEVIHAGNYTTTDAGTIGVAQTAANVASFFNYTGNSWQCSYTGVHAGEVYADTNKTLIGLGTFGDFWEIIILAIVISIVIGLLLVVFGGRRER